MAAHTYAGVLEDRCWIGGCVGGRCTADGQGDVGGLRMVVEASKSWP